MNIRETIEKNEHLFLSEFAQKADESRGREVFELPCPLRTCFQRDRDRIIHSKAFRRLKHKTQVFLTPELDHYRTRLTHTLEVSQVARTIARALSLNEDLTEAIALGHDLGHTPFGHAGEAVLNEVSSLGFKHYEQSVRVVEFLEKDGKGLNLSKEVRDGILSHQVNSKALTLEGDVVRFADKIAYINHDIDDAISAKVLRNEDIPKEIRNVLGNAHSERLTTMILAIVESSINKNEITMKKEVFDATYELRRFLFKNIYDERSQAKKEEEKAKRIVKMLYEFYIEKTDLLPAFYKEIIKTEGKERAVMDYIAGMSDTYAVRVFENLFIPKAWSE